MELNKEYIVFHPEQEWLAIAKNLGMNTVKLSNEEYTLWVVDQIIFDFNWVVLGEL